MAQWVKVCCQTPECTQRKVTASLYKLGIPALGRWRQGNQEFHVRASIGYMRPCLRKKLINK